MAVYTKGYTVIEVMLFLAVSGALAAAIMLTAGANISAQRYKDAVATFEADLQQQFEASAAVVNDRTSTVGSCSGTVGRSDCLMLGTYTVVRANGGVSRYVVYGKEPTSGSPSSEIQLLRNYKPTINPASVETSLMEWGTGVKKQGSGTNPLTFGLLVLRSPETGSVFSFYQTLDDASLPSGAAVELTDMVNDSNQKQQVICVDTTGWLAPERLAVVIRERARSANAIEIMSSTMLSQEGLAQCY